MTKDYEWGSHRTVPSAGKSVQEISAMEQKLGVSFPDSLRNGYRFSDDASIFKNGTLCDEAITGPKDKGGHSVGYFGYLEGLTTIPNETLGLKEWVDDAFEREIPDVFPFARLGGGGWTCLNYQNDPTRANPQVWQFDMNGTSYDDCFTKVADSFDQFIGMLAPTEVAESMGF